MANNIIGTVGIGAQSVKPDWNQNDPNAKDYIKNRPGGYVVAPSVEITWDGDVTGKETVALFNNATLVKIADEAPSIEKFAVGTSYKAIIMVEAVSSDGSGTDTSRIQAELQATDGAWMFARSLSDMTIPVVLGVTADSFNVDDYTFTKGMWFLFVNAEEEKQFPRSISTTDGGAKKFPESFIPDEVWSDISYAQEDAVIAKNTAETARNTANTAKTTAETAQNTANTAKNTAETAQSKANNALLNSNEALTIARGAQSKVAKVEKNAASKDNPEFTGSFSQNRKPDTIIGQYSHAEGASTTASGLRSHAEGSQTVASGQDSHAEGWHTIAQGTGQHVEGRYNIPSGNGDGGFSYGDYVHIVGNGLQESARSNAYTLTWYGVPWYHGRPQFGGNAMDDGAKTVMGNGDKEIILSSSTPNSTKKYKITVDDTGTITATEVTT